MAQMNLSTEQKQTHGHREQTCCCEGGRRGGRMDCEFGFSRHKLLHLEWISNEVLLYTAQGTICNLLGYICINESLCCTAEIGTTL